jgi:hypothetical protein
MKHNLARGECRSMLPAEAERESNMLAARTTRRAIAESLAARAGAREEIGLSLIPLLASPPPVPREAGVSSSILGRKDEKGIREKI